MTPFTIYAGDARTRGRAALARCVGDPDAFLTGQWAREPLHRPGADPASFADLADAAAVDRLLDDREFRVRYADARLVRTVEGRFRAFDPAEYTTDGDRIDPAAVRRLIGDGASLALQLVDRYWPPLERFCRDLELYLGHPCQATIYLTPPGEQGLDVHHDLHDVLVLMLEGEKEFSLYDPVIADPVDGQRMSQLAVAPPELRESATLHAGDVLYLPRGVPHSAVSRRTRSLHLTIGIRTATWHALAAPVLRDALTACAADPTMRRSVPVGAVYANGDWSALVDEYVERLTDTVRTLARRDFADGVASRLLASRPGDYGDRPGWLDRAGAALVTTRTRVRLKPGALVVVRADGQGVEVRLSGGRVLRTAAREAAALEEILAAPDGRPVDAPALGLVRLLLREGVLELVGP